MYIMIMLLLHCHFTDQRKHVSDDGSDDFFEYTRGKKIPPEGIPGFDFSDPESIVEFTKYVCKSVIFFILSLIKVHVSFIN